MKIRIGGFRKIGILFLLGLASGWGWSQSTTVSTVGVVDHDGFTWAGGTYTIQFSPNPSFPGIGSYVWSGGNLQNNLQFAGSLDGAGAFSVSIPDTTTITPAGSAWNIIICPNATSGCFSTRTPVFGATFSVTTQLNALAAGPRFTVSVSAHGYADVEITPVPLPGGTYYNVTTNFIRVWSGTSWSNIGGGGGSGQVLASPQFQVGYFPSPGTIATVQGVPSAFTSDAQGNVRTKSNDGLNNAFGNQSAPGANNGIQDALQTIGNIVVAGPDYPCTEGTFSTGTGYRLGIGVPAPFANVTELLDIRPQCARGFYLYNPNPASTLYTFDRVVSNQQPQTSGNGFGLIPFFSDFELSGSGKNGFEGGLPDSWGYSQQNFEFMRRGIGSMYNTEGQLLSLGDTHVYGLEMTVNRGSTDASGEGFQVNRWQIGQNLLPMVTTANSTHPAGATLIQGTLVSNNPFPQDGTYYINATKGSSLFKLTAWTSPGAFGAGSAGTWTVDATLVPDNIGRSSNTVATPKQYYGATTNETITVTGLAHTLCSGNTAWNGSTCAATSAPATACYADQSYQESAVVVSLGSFSGGTQTATLALRYTHLPNAYISQGVHACNAVEAEANQLPGTFVGRQLFRIIGAQDSHTYLYARTVFGFWDNAPGGFYTPSVVAAAGATLTRNGSGIVSVATSDGGLLFSGNAIIVSGCSDSSFNSTFTIVTDTGSVVTWANAGSAGTTTCTNPIELVSRRSGTGVRVAQEFPAVEIVNTNDPVTFAINYNISVEPNMNFQVTAGDQLEDHTYNDVVMAFDNELMNFQSENSDNVATVLHATNIGGDIPVGTTFARIAFTDPILHYQGLGGTVPIGNTLYDYSANITPFNILFNELPPPKTSAFTFRGCLFGCADARSNFTWLGLPTNNGFYQENILQNNSEFDTLNHNIVTSERQDTQSTPTTFVRRFNNGGFAAAERNSVEIFQPASIEHDLFDASTGITSHFIETAASLSIDVPFIAPSATFSGTPYISTGTASNTDVAGHLTLVAGTVVYTFAATHTAAPNCVATDNTAIAAAQTVTTTTTLTINGTGTDVVSYVCIGTTP